MLIVRVKLIYKFLKFPNKAKLLKTRASGMFVMKLPITPTLRAIGNPLFFTPFAMQNDRRVRVVSRIIHI